MIREFEQKSGATRVPVVAVTANAYPEDREYCLQVGMDDFIAKPVNARGLRDKLSRWLAKLG